MVRYVLWVGVAIVLFTSGLGVASPVTKGPFTEEQNIGPFDTYFFPIFAFRGGERSSAFAIGDYSSFMGLYVYDVNGNCVAWDDESPPSPRDDNYVEWVPGTTSDHAIELRNLGIYANKVRMVVR